MLNNVLNCEFGKVVVPASKVTEKSAVKQALEELREKKTEETSLLN